MRRSLCGIVAVLVAALCLLPFPAVAQVTTGMITGRVVDASGAVVPGAKVILISEAQGTKTAPLSTNETGDYVFPNITPDTYTVEVTAASFKTSRITGIVVTGGDRVGVPSLTLELGGTTETVTVTAEAALVQTQSGERSYAIENKQIEELPFGHANFMNFVALTPGVTDGGLALGNTRLGGMSQNNLMMDGISAMDTGNNGQMLSMNIESIGEVKVLTQGYAAEYGRASGLQITAVTKSGSNQFHGSGYGLLTDSDWNNNSWVNTKNGDPKAKTDSQIFGYSIGGPVIAPKVFNGRNKLFFFYAHEYRPTTSTTNSGNPVRLRVPSAAERAGDYSQSRDNNGNLLPPLMDYLSGTPFPNQQIPAARLYAPGVRVLNQYPLPNVTQGPGMNYNYQMDPVSYSNLTQQPAVRIDYQATGKLRFSGKYSGQRARQLVTPGTIPGFNDTYNPYPYVTNMGTTVTYMISPTTFIEGTYGFIKNQLGSPPINAASNRLTQLPDLPMLFPNSGVLDPRYYEYQALQDIKPPFWDGKSINMAPTFSWGSRIGAAPPSIAYPGFLNINKTQDFAISLTRIMGRHTIKAGVYLDHSYKAQNVGSGGGISNVNLNGNLNFGNDTNNTLDSGFGYSNAALGVFTQYIGASRLVEGNMIYNQWEWYLQDNWKVNNRLTLDYGMRFVNQGPAADKFGQESNFFPDQWKQSAAPVLYVAGCKSGKTACTGNDRNAMDPRNGQILTVTGMANTAAAIGTPIPGTTNPMNGVKAAGDGISKNNYIWPKVVFGPRFGVAYDVTGKSTWVLRGGVGIFYDRPDENTVFGIPGNPPMATVNDLRNGTLGSLGQGGLSMQPVPALSTFQYNAPIPTSLQWQAGFQKSLPGGFVGDVMYVGNHGYNRLSYTQGVYTQNLNAIDIGTAYLAKYQDPTLGTSTVPGATAYTTNLLRPMIGFGAIQQQTFAFWDTYHSMQFSLNRRFSKGFSFGISETWGLSLKGNTYLLQRFTHDASGMPHLSADWDRYQKLNENEDVIPHLIKANGVWAIPGLSGKGAAIHQLTSDWQISGVLTLKSGGAFDPTYSYQTNGANVNITGSPDYGGKIVYVNPAAIGQGCSDNQYAQFDYKALKGPTYGSTGMESGRYLMRGCWTRNFDFSLVRRIRLGTEKVKMQFRADAFNALNTAQINARSTTATFDNPTSMTLQNSQYNADGSLNQNRLTPRNAGFGAATGALTMRNIQLQLRLEF